MKTVDDTCRFGAAGVTFVMKRVEMVVSRPTEEVFRRNQQLA